MSYITLGNLTRFLNKLKDYLGNNYLKLTGGTVTGDVDFNRDIKANRVHLRSIACPITLVSNGDGNMAKEQDEKFYAFLDEKNYTEYVPKLDGTGATGTWAINISGNALNDSDGNKIVDTYAKKSEVGSTPDLTPYMKKKADDNLTMGGNSIFFPGATITSRPQNNVPSLYIDAKGSRGVFVNGYIIMNNATVATEDFVRTNYVPLSNGHISINGSELWIE